MLLLSPCLDLLPFVPLAVPATHVSDDDVAIDVAPANDGGDDDTTAAANGTTTGGDAPAPASAAADAGAGSGAGAGTGAGAGAGAAAEVADGGGSSKSRGPALRFLPDPKAPVPDHWKVLY